MVNKALFSTRDTSLPSADAKNEAGGRAYSFSNAHALAQYAATGTLSHTFYADAENQLQTLLQLADGVHPEFIAKTAVFARERAYMKDVPALLCALLSKGDPALLARIFPRVIDNGRMLRNFVQIMRSGMVGRRSLGSLPRRLVRQWLDSRSDDAVFRASVGRSPSLTDIIKMVHPKPSTNSRDALYGYLLGKPHDASQLSELVRSYEGYKAGRTKVVPCVPFQLLTGLELGTREWTEIARRAKWQMTRMNLNTFLRHGVFDQPGMTELIAERLRDAGAIAEARVFPYQLLIAYLHANEKVPPEIRLALQDAMEIAVSNVPELPGKVYVFPDVSGSMRSAITGARKGATSKVRCVDVAALVAASVLRRNRSAEVLPFENQVVSVELNPLDSIMTNAETLARVGGGGTSCSAPLAELNRRKAKGDLVIYVSDSESWVDSEGSSDTWRSNLSTQTLSEWSKFRRRNPKARMVCIDVQPYRTCQAPEREDILHVGGFSDQVFDLVAAFARGGLDAARWVDVIDKVEL